MKTITVVLIGAGDRGTGYTRLMNQLGEKYKVVAVAEPVESRRNQIRDWYGIPEEQCFLSWEPLLAQGKIADLAMICTQDQLHLAPALEAIEKGYDLLLEKPVSPEPEDCLRIARAAEKAGVKVVVCHVLRYTPFFQTIKDCIDSGRLGEIVSINHEECVGNVHQSHSYVRGNWGNLSRSACMLLAKSCHDIDILQWLVGKKCEKVQSFGSLTHFRAENVPAGAPERCIDGCPAAETCPYNSVRLYLDDKKNIWFRGAATMESDPTDEQVEHALRTTQYGKCVYRCDNDVVDHQVVNMLFEDGITVTFTMCAFNRGGRFIHIMGTKGELRGAMDGETPITLYDFETRQTQIIPIKAQDGITSGHGGGDAGLIYTLYDYLTDAYTGNAISDISISTENHLTVFAAEQARAQSSVVDLEEYLHSFDAKGADAEG